MRAGVLACLVAIGLGVSVTGSSPPEPDRRPSFVPKDGFVPNAETAKRIAEAVLIPIYTRETVEREKPFSARLTGGVWTIEGTLPHGLDGGTAVVELAKRDGRILRVAHFQ